MLGTGERLPFDRLILATGSEAFVPEIAGFGGPGTFVLRTASDALGDPRVRPAGGRARRAVVAGGGLLGLEAAYALHKLGLRTTVLERSRWLLRRQLDERAGELLRGYLANLGIEVLVEAETAALENGSRGRSPTAGACAADVVPRGGRASRRRPSSRGTPGSRCERGVLVDDHLRTSDPRIFAAGDLAEWRGSILGLWPVAVEQAEVAAENAVGGSRPYAGTVPVTMLKVVGVELLSIGAIDGPRELVDADAGVAALPQARARRGGPRDRRDPARPPRARADA